MGGWWSRRDWEGMPDNHRRIRMAIGDEPIPNRSHLLPALPGNSPDPPANLPAPIGQVEFPSELIVTSPNSWDSRTVWRTALSLGLSWGHLDLFHWQCPETGRSWFCIHRLEEPAGFLPERVPEGDRVRGIVLLRGEQTHDCAEAVWGRMLLAASAWIAAVGGQPIDRAGNPISLQTFGIRPTRRPD